jgi:[ribosomal protein S5]-alanine N-acetyltransferase
LRTLHTERLTLEPLVAKHAEAMFSGLHDPELFKFLAERRPESVEWLRQRYERLSMRQSPDGNERWWNWVVKLRCSRELAGYVQATIDETQAEIAYVVFRAYWSRGLGREAVAAMIQELYDVGVTTITACADRQNTRSRSLLEHLDFVERPLPDYRREDAADDVWYVLDRSRPGS